MEGGRCEGEEMYVCMYVCVEFRGERDGIGVAEKWMDGLINSELIN